MEGRRICTVFDGDDTLWITEPLYDEARSEARRIVESSGLDGDRWEAMERRIDVENVETLGYSPERFPRSCRQAYEAYQRTCSATVDPAISNRIERIAMSVFERPAQLMPGAEETVRTLKRAGVGLGLLTKGDLAVQRKRIADSSLAPLFDVISIVPMKTALEVRRIMERLESPGCLTWVVGNSIRSDIVPALEAGANAIWIDAHVWEYERATEETMSTIDSRVVRAHNLSDALRMICR